MRHQNLTRDIPLPKQWRQFVKSGVLHVISLANLSIVTAWGCLRRQPRRVRHNSQVDRRDALIAQLHVELLVKNARMRRAARHAWGAFMRSVGTMQVNSRPKLFAFSPATGVYPNLMD